MEKTIEDLVRPCKTISAEKSVRDFLKQLDRQLDWFCLVTEKDEVVGIVDEKDLIRLLKPRSIPGMDSVIIDEVVKKDFESPVSSIMTQSLITVSSQASPREALDLMTTRGLSYLIVVDGGKHGFVRLSDVLERAVGGL